MTIDTFKMPDGSVFRIEEWLHWPLFSTVEGAAGAPVDLYAFSYVVGMQVPQAGAISTGRRNATQSDTNQVVRNKLNHDEAMIVFSTTYEVWAIEGSNNQDSVYLNPPLDDEAVAPILSGTNHALMKRDMLLELFVGSNITKPMFQAPLAYVGQGIGAYATGSGDALTIANGGATALNLNYGTGGQLGPKDNQRLLNMPILISSDRTIKVRLRTPAGALLVDQDWRFRVYLDGMKRRPVA
jgi:hypothetical protein